MTNPTLIEELRELYNVNEDMEAIIAALRRRGYSKARSIMAVAEITRLDLQDAKIIVHESTTWSDVREAHDQFLDEISETLESSCSSCEED
jgi:ribosomal protein L7/L12